MTSSILNNLELASNFAIQLAFLENNELIYYQFDFALREYDLELSITQDSVFEELQLEGIIRLSKRQLILKIEGLCIQIAEELIRSDLEEWRKRKIIQGFLQFAEHMSESFKPKMKMLEYKCREAARQRKAVDEWEQ